MYCLTRNLTVALVVLLLLRTNAFSQAAAESVLLGATTSTATIKAGSSMNSSFNKASAQTGKRVQHVIHPATGQVRARASRRPTTIVQHPSVPPGAGKTTGNVVASIQGAAGNCASAQPNCSAGVHTQTPKKYQSVITLAPAK
jgi:hypothetical protein